MIIMDNIAQEYIVFIIAFLLGSMIITAALLCAAHFLLKEIMRRLGEDKWFSVLSESLEQGRTPDITADGIFSDDECGSHRMQIEEMPSEKPFRCIVVPGTEKENNTLSRF